MSEEDYDGKWQVSDLDCNACGWRFVSVHPAVCEYLECPTCQHMNPAPYVEEPSEP